MLICTFSTIVAIHVNLFKDLVKMHLFQLIKYCQPYSMNLLFPVKKFVETDIILSNLSVMMAILMMEMVATLIAKWKINEHALLILEGLANVFWRI